MPTLALIAHDEKKDEIVAFCQRHRTKLSTLQLIATGTTGKRISSATGLEVECLLSGPMGGDAQIASRVATGQVSAVFFLVDPLSAHPHEPDKSHQPNSPTITVRPVRRVRPSTRR